jgi:hypothetical protein
MEVKYWRNVDFGEVILPKIYICIVSVNDSQRYICQMNKQHTEERMPSQSWFNLHSDFLFLSYLLSKNIDF